MPRAHFLLVPVLALVAACTQEHERPLELRPVVAENVKALKAAIGPEPEVPQADLELVDRARQLVQTVAKQKGSMRESFAEQAKELGDAIVPLLSGWIGELGADPDARRAEAELLAAIDTPKSARALVFHAMSHPQAWMRAQCAWRLASSTQDQVVPRLIEASMSEKDNEVRTYLGSTLARFGCYHFSQSDPEIARRWKFGDPDGKLATPAPSKRLQLEIWWLVETFGKEDGHASGQALRVLGHMPAYAADILAAALRDENLNVRNGSAHALALMGPRAAAAGPALIESLQRDPTIRITAIEALAALHYQPAADVIAQRLEPDHPVDVRAAAALALGKLDTPRHVPALERAIGTTQPAELRAAAASALLSLGREREALPTLAELYEAHWSVIDDAIARWLEARAAAGDTEARSLLEAWNGPAVVLVNRQIDENVRRQAALLKGEIQKLAR